jgi:hypothetical protein
MSGIAIGLVINPKNFAASSAVRAGGAEGSGGGPAAAVKPASRKQEPQRGINVYAQENGCETSTRIEQCKPATRHGLGGTLPWPP